MRLESAVAATALVGLAGCPSDSTSTRVQAVEAFCDATVNTASGPVTVDVETDYLPRVVTCENGNAAPAALEAQAIAARSYLYYKLERFIQYEISNGAPLKGTYPPDEATLARYHDSQFSR